MTPRIALLLGLACLGLPGCGQRQKTGKPFGTCSAAVRCPSPYLCLFPPDAHRGTCVMACDRDPDCTPGQRCTGQFKAPADTRRRGYCQRALVGTGGDCSRLLDGCLLGLECLDGQHCERVCQRDGDCRPDERCHPVLQRPSFGRPAEKRYHRCIAATKKEHDACGPEAPPQCGRGLRCYARTCVTTCRSTADCGPGRACSGEADAADGEATDGEAGAFQFCRRVVGLGQPCTRILGPRDVGCEDGLRCHRNRCRRTCVTDEECPETDGRKTRCVSRKIRRERVRICL